MKKFSFLVVALLVVLVAGCGGGGNVGTTSEGGSKSAALSTAPQIEGKEFAQPVQGTENSYKSNGGSGVYATWKPGVAGTYEILVRPQPAKVYYAVYKTIDDITFAASGDTSTDGWVKLQGLEGTVFRMDDSGMVVLSLGQEESPEDYPADAENLKTSSEILVTDIKFVPVADAGTPAVPVETTPTFESYSSRTVAKAAATRTTGSISKIDGFNLSGLVSNGRWLGQPSGAPNHGNYYNYLCLETTSDNSYAYWYIRGSGFGTQKGGVTFSNSAISAKVVSWTDKEIKIIPSASYKFNAANVTAYVYGDDGKVCWEIARINNLQVMPLIKSRGFRQCTWYVAYKRLLNSLAIPPSAYSSSTITASYVPKRWDCLTYGSSHVAIISSDVSKSSKKEKDGSTTTTYSFNVGEANAAWDELIYDSGGDRSPYAATFIVNVSSNGKTTKITGSIGTNSSRTKVATGYWR